MVQNGMDMHSGRQSMRPRRRCVVKESAFLILYWRYHSSAFRNSGRSRKAGDFSRLRRQETMLGQAGCLADGIDPAVGIRQIARWMPTRLSYMAWETGPILPSFRIMDRSR